MELPLILREILQYKLFCFIFLGFVFSNSPPVCILETEELRITSYEEMGFFDEIDYLIITTLEKAESKLKIMHERNLHKNLLLEIEALIARYYKLTKIQKHNSKYTYFESLTLLRKKIYEQLGEILQVIFLLPI